MATTTYRTSILGESFEVRMEAERRRWRADLGDGYGPVVAEYVHDHPAYQWRIEAECDVPYWRVVDDGGRALLVNELDPREALAEYLERVIW